MRKTSFKVCDRALAVAGGKQCIKCEGGIKVTKKVWKAVLKSGFRKTRKRSL